MPVDYEKIKADAIKRNLALSHKGRDIADHFPPEDTIDWKRRNECGKSLRLFLETYFQESFWLAWSPDHLRIIAQLETAIIEGGLFAYAMPRGSGKSTLVERAALWAILYGHRRYVCMIGATQDAAENLLLHIKSILQFNLLLLQDFPCACYPIVKLENRSSRTNGQHYGGSPTLITWVNDKLVFPTIERKDSSCNGSVITTAGITGSVRGQS